MEAKKLLVFLYEKHNGDNGKVYECIKAHKPVEKEEYDKFYDHYGQAFDQHYVTVLDKEFPKFLREEKAGELGMTIEFMVFPRRLLKFMPLIERSYRESAK